MNNDRIMERKIGEIFEYNGEWYQCVIGGHCKDCALNEGRKCYTLTNNNDPIGDCSAERRTDKYSVIFKKLEKVGEPYKYSIQHRGIVMLQPHKLFTPPIKINGVVYNVNYDTYTIDLEIKQNKENMETKKVFMNDDDRDYLLDKLESILHDNHCWVYKEEICNSLCKYIASIHRELKPFNLEDAKAGKLICTRDGRQVKIIYLDTKGSRPIVALVTECDNEEETPYKYHSDGSYNCPSIPSDNDLMLLPERKEGWVNVYKRNNEYICENECNVSTGITVYESEGEAKRNINRDAIYVNTIKITWAE